MNIGFIGLGVMGTPMAGHLADAGHSIFTCLNRSPLPEELSSKGVEVVANPAEVRRRAAIPSLSWFLTRRMWSG